MQNPNALELPALGEVFKLVFELSGLLANKYNHSQVIDDEKRKKTIQKQLQRLARGEGNVESLYNDLRNQLYKLLSETIAQPNVVAAALASFDSIYHSIQNTLKEQHTYLTKKETAKWLIECGIGDALVLNAQKHALLNNIPYSSLRVPHIQEWWAPHFNISKTQWSLERVWRWIYEETGTSHTRFHCPDGENPIGKQNLENASRWFNRGRLPSWSELQNNLKVSAQLLEECGNNRYRRTISPELKSNFETVLFFARFATAAWIKLQEEFGEAFTRHLATRMKSQSRRLRKEIARLHAMNAELVLKLPPVSEQMRNALLLGNIELFWELRSNKISSDATLFQNEIVNKRDSFCFTLGELKTFVKKYDRFTLSMLLTQLRYSPTQKQIYYVILYKVGRDLLLSRSLSLAQVSNFEKQIKASNNEGDLKWLALWMLGELNVQEEKFDIAFDFYNQAFEDAKTRAGSELYLFVNKFASVCAKANKWSRFKKLMNWAKHNGIEIRILRNFDMSDENIRDSFELLKKINYVN